MEFAGWMARNEDRLRQEIGERIDGVLELARQNVA